MLANFLNRIFKLSLVTLGMLALALPLGAVTLTIDFDDYSLETGQYINGSDGYGALHSDRARLDNNYNKEWGSWDGFAISRVNNNTTPGYENQFAVYGDGRDKSRKGSYAVGYYSEYSANNLGQPSSTITLPHVSTVRGLYVNNTTYTALSLLYGDAFAKKFGGSAGTDPDWLKLTIIGYDTEGVSQGEVDFYLADFRFEDSSRDYIVDEWTWVDLATLGSTVRSIAFVIESSDTEFGFMNTPAYFAIDDLKIVPTASLLVSDLDGLRLMGESGSWKGDEFLAGFDDLGVSYGTTFTDWGGGYTYWSGFACSHVNDTQTESYLNDTAVWGAGLDRSGGGNYSVFYDGGDFAEEEDRITFYQPALVKGLYINNTTYAALSMLNGDGFAKKFGGPLGTDPDWFMLTIVGRDANGTMVGSTNVYLADYRSANPAEDYIIDEWTWVDLADFGPAVSALNFSLASSDTGDFGMNTPAYFALDELTYVYTFSDSMQSDNIFDAAIPGFVGDDGLGVSDEILNVVNPLFAAWATGVDSYYPTPDVWPQWQDSSKALGPVTGFNMDIVSLGDLDAGQIAANMAPGEITLTFATPISDKEGPDFAVFENAFIMDYTTTVFAELGFVEVSSDGINFARFPSTSLNTNDVGPYGTVDVRYVNNLIGAHVNAYGDSWGTPFDLGDLTGHPLVLDGLVELDNITYVRIIDIPGNGSVLDDFSPPNPIRDAWHTWGSGGVDLEAVGVINSKNAARIAITIEGAGEVNPLGYPVRAVSVAHGLDQTFTFTPEGSSVVCDVIVDGLSLGAMGSHTFSNLQADHSLTVVFGPAAEIKTIHGVPVSWLDEMGLVGASDAERALSDPDGDGLASWQEYYAGTDPLDAQSRFAITGFERDDDTVAVTWQGGRNGSPLPFILYGTEKLGGTWKPIATDLPKAFNGINIWQGTPAPAIRFFRVGVEEER